MGGLRKKMPITAYTMLIGCLAIAGAGVPFLAGFSGFHSKDVIVEQALSHWNSNAKFGFSWLFYRGPLVGAAITAFYMFRLWFMTFAGEPRDHHRYDHAHESPQVMTGPLVVLAVFAVCAGWHFRPGRPACWRTSASRTCWSRPGRWARSPRPRACCSPILRCRAST